MNDMNETSKNQLGKTESKITESKLTESQVGMDSGANSVVSFLTNAPLTNTPRQSIVSRFLVMVASVVVIGYGVSAASKIIGPLFLALFLSIILHVPLQWMQKKGCPKIIALIIVIVFTVIIFFGLSYHVAKSLNYLVAKSPEYKANLEAKIAAIDKRLERIGIAISGLTAWRMLMENKQNEANKQNEDDDNIENKIIPESQFDNNENINNSNNRFNNSIPITPKVQNPPTPPSTFTQPQSNNSQPQNLPIKNNDNLKNNYPKIDKTTPSEIVIDANNNKVNNRNDNSDNKNADKNENKTVKESDNKSADNKSGEDVKIKRTDEVVNVVAAQVTEGGNDASLTDNVNTAEAGDGEIDLPKTQGDNIRNDKSAIVTDSNLDGVGNIETTSLSEFLGAAKGGFGFLTDGNDSLSELTTNKAKQTISSKEKSQLILLDSQDVMIWLRTSLVAIREIGESAFLVLIFTIFMVFEAASFPSKVDRALGFDGPINNQHLQRISGEIRRYLFLKAISSMMSAVAATVVYWFFGVPAMFFWGLVAFFLYFIPNVGGILASIIPGLLIFMTHDWQGVVIYAVCLVGIECTIGYGIEPKMLGHGLGISTVVILLSLFTWGMLLGPIGLFMAAPLTIMVKIILQAFKESEWIATLIDRK
ncbi:MAG: AI-2E family transporter [Planctomycetaceae bacterium]|jgi:predicted PurR-regulated permease PerM|nr:AI-2E family transporter [Planctomycetaceae bacterium]